MSKMVSMKEQKFEFEVPIIVTTISMIVSLSTAGIFMLLQGLQRLTSFHLKNNFMFLCFLQNTLKWIVVQKVIVHLANRHNELKKLCQFKKFHEKKLRQHEASQFQRRLKMPSNYLERPQNSEIKKQFEICTKRERQDEGVFMKKKPYPNRKVGFSPRSTVNDIDQINLS
jgi:hypothetical protein